MEVRLSEPQAAENRTETCFLQTDKKRLQIHRQGMQLPERKIPAYKHSAWVLQKFRYLITVCPPVPMTGIFRTSGGGKIPSMRKPVCAFFYMPVPWCQGIRAAPLQFSYVKTGNPPAAPEGFVKSGCSCGRGHLLVASFGGGFPGQDPIACRCFLPGERTAQKIPVTCAPAIPRRRPAGKTASGGILY